MSQRCGSVWCHPGDEDKTGSDMSFLWGIHYLYVAFVSRGGRGGGSVWRHADDEDETLVLA